jgi:hypothetical protein
MMFDLVVQGGISILLVFILVHVLSLLLPLVHILVRSSSTRHWLYWSFNILFPSLNSEVLLTSLLARQSHFCQLAHVLFDAIDFHPLGDDTIEWNVVVLIVHILLLLSLVIVMDRRVLRWSLPCFSRSTPFDERTLDADVLLERQRLLDDDDQLIVRDLVKSYPGRKSPAVNHLTFAARRGEAFGLLGFNVSAKR